MPGLGGISFGGGFATGLSNALIARRQERLQQEERQSRNAQQFINFAINSGQLGGVEDIPEPLLQMAFPMAEGTGKGGKEKQALLRNTIHQAIQGTPGTPLMPGPAAQQQEPLPSRPIGSPSLGPMATEPPPVASSPVSIQPGPATVNRPTLMGIPLLSRQEVAQRQLSEKIGGTEQEISAKIALARRILPALQSADPSANLDDALAAVGIRPPTQRTGAEFQAVYGEDAEGKPVAAVFDRNLGLFVDQFTRKPIPGFHRSLTTGSTSLGADRESVSRELFGKRAADLTPEQMTAVNKRVEEMAAGKAGAVTTARGEAAAKNPLTSAQRFSALRDLQGDWRKAEAPEKETNRQLQIMETGLKRFKEGDKNGGSQAVLVTFQKILDPNSVVRESEYDRSPEGLGLKQRMEGFIDRLKGGGAGVPAEDLEAMVQTAREFVKGMADYNALERERIGQAAKEAGLEPDRVFGVAAAPAGGGAKTTTTGTQPPAPPGMEWRDGKLFIKQ